MFFTTTVASLRFSDRPAVARIRLLATAVVLVMLVPASVGRAGDFRVDPYVQNPAEDAMTVMWFSQANTAGSLSYSTGGGGTTVVNSTPVLAAALSYDASETGPDPGTPYLHQVRLTGLSTGTVYDYTVTQGATAISAEFHTPSANQSVRFLVYGDSETEPESTGAHVSWTTPAAPPSPADPRPGAIMNYLLDQTTGYQQNLNVMQSRSPDFIAIAGDLVQSGGEQRDWDVFWRHNAGSLNNIAASTPILAAPGNHEQFDGSAGGYATGPSNASMDKYLTYFDVPANGATNAAHEGRYFRQDYGPVTMIALDVTNGLPDDSNKDTNWHLAGAANAPDFNPGSEQYTWLETQLADAQQNSQFTFVFFHHVPYSVGPHGWPAGILTPGLFDPQSGVPVRALTPLFQRYGVDAVLAGHDEMYERSAVPGTEQLPGGGTKDYDMQVYDIGIGGDGLRGPQDGLSNSFQQFLAHTDSLEEWAGNELLDGGKHYGHLEVNVFVNPQGFWQATFTPVFVFPVTDSNGNLTGAFERRVYDDEINSIGQAVIPAPRHGSSSGRARGRPGARVEKEEPGVVNK